MPNDHTPLPPRRKPGAVRNLDAYARRPCDPPSRTCKLCHIEKPIEQFATSAATSRRTECVPCFNAERAAKMRKHRAEKTDYYHRQLACGRTPERRALINERRRSDPIQQIGNRADHRRWLATPAGQQRAKAHYALNQAVKHGRVHRPDNCCICGVNPGVARNGRRLLRADHHHGYDPAHWLDVQWVCPKCDGNLERERTATGTRPQ